MQRDISRGIYCTAHSTRRRHHLLTLLLWPRRHLKNAREGEEKGEGGMTGRNWDRDKEGGKKRRQSQARRWGGKGGGRRTKGGKQITDKTGLKTSEIRKRWDETDEEKEEGREEEETEEGKWKTRRRAMWSREDEKGEWKSRGSEGLVMDWWTRSKSKGEKRGSMKRSFARRIQTQRMERWEEGEVWWWGRERRMEPRIEASGVAVRKLNWNEPASNQTKNKLIRWGILLTPASPHSQFQGTWFWSVIEWSSSITETWNAICIITSVLFGFLLERTERWPDNPALQDTTSL